ncbi:ankyrin repeat domain-containing protein [Streptomyces sp. NA04227]|uniref:ankyrin repeat domain-containing protein n=1 Tax=Streptomyces sp. NA04227 TaxID=2742136 RepID=UPI0020CA8C61|nr:ankyrin repeat domain-containing protein [Streptomyces sp. NA04227]
MTVHLAVFRKVRRQRMGRRQSGLRVGLRFSDGRRVTSLDATVTRRVEISGVQGPAAAWPQTEQATGLIPLDPGLHHSSRSLFKTDVDLYLAELPPAGPAQLVLEWPDEGIVETRTTVDMNALHSAATQVHEVWPGIEQPDPSRQPERFGFIETGGPPDLLAPPLSRDQREELRRQEKARERYVPRADWEGMVYGDWNDDRLVRARLAGGASPNSRAGWRAANPLHAAAEQGTAQTVRTLLAHRADVDALDDEAHTALWYAACGSDEGIVRALIDAGADVWTPQAGPWSPGRLLLTTPMARLLADVPGAVELPAEEARAFREADRLIAAFGEEEIWTEGLGITFVSNLSEDEVIRRLGGDPGQCPKVGPDQSPFDPEDYEASLDYVGVSGLAGAPGGCVIVQDGYMPSDEAVLRAISPGSTAYGIYFNPKGGTFGTLARDGEIVEHEEIGLWADATGPAAPWHFRFWQHDHPFPHGANCLAYACAAAGMRIDDGRAAVDREAPQRWVLLPAALRD